MARRASNEVKLALALLVACSAPRTAAPPKVDRFHELLVTREQCRETPPATLTVEQALVDVDVVARVLRGGYAGFDTIAKRGANWEIELARLRSDVAAMKSITVDDLRTHIATSLAFTNDSHLGTYTLTAGGSRKWTSAGHHADAYTPSGSVIAIGRDGVLHTMDNQPPSPLVGCNDQPADRVIRPVFFGERIGGSVVGRTIVVLSKQPLSTINCKTEHRTVEVPARAVGVGTADIGTAFEVFPRAYPYLRLRSLDPSQGELLETFERMAQEIRDKPVIVLDVRGNQGGGDEPLREFFRDLIGPAQTNTSFREHSSAVVDQGILNALTCDLIDATGDRREELEKQRATIRERLEARAAGKHQGGMRGRVATSVRVGGKPFVYQGTFIVIADRNCASSCEQAIAYARQLPNSIVVGENTGGVGEFGEVLPYRLPNSRIWLQVASKTFDGVPPEGVGHLPDLWLDVDDLPQTIDFLVECVSDPRCAQQLRP